MTPLRRPNTAQAPIPTAEGTQTVPERCSDGSSRPTPIILDVDTGVDDACALLLAALHPDVELLAVTCVSGNASVDDVVRNTMKVLDVAGCPDVPVARGADKPLLEPRGDARHVHGDDGMADLGWPASPRQVDGRHAVELLRDLLSQAAAGKPSDRITLVPLAPLTNIALLLRTYPEAADGLREIVFMGGAAEAGNATASAEFNVWHDPEAAAIVLESAAELDIPVVMYGLDVFYDVRVSREQAAGLITIGGRGAAELAGRLIDYQCDRFGQTDATIGDAGAVCAVIDRLGLTTMRLPVRVELAGTYSRGRTIVDRRDWSGDLAHDPHGVASTSVEVAMSVDSDRYARLWMQTMRDSAR
jgi:inosine-uridine nucleoside N-ribohydrolase